MEEETQPETKRNHLVVADQQENEEAYYWTRYAEWTGPKQRSVPRSYNNGEPSVSVSNSVFSPNGMMLFFGYSTRMIICYDVLLEQPINARDCESGMSALACCPKGKHVAAAFAGGYNTDVSSIYVWNMLDSGKDEIVFQSKELVIVHALLFSWDGLWLFSGARANTVWVWDIEKRCLLRVLEGHTDWPNALAVSGSICISGSWDKTIKFWNANGECIRTLTDHLQAVRVCATNADGSLLASGSADNTIKIFEVATGTCIQTLTVHDDSQGIYSLSFHVNGTHLASGLGNSSIKIWEWRTGKCLQTIVHHRDKVREIDYSLMDHESLLVHTRKVFAFGLLRQIADSGRLLLVIFYYFWKNKSKSSNLSET